MRQGLTYYARKQIVIVCLFCLVIFTITVILLPFVYVRDLYTVSMLAFSLSLLALLFIFLSGISDIKEQKKTKEIQEDLTPYYFYITVDKKTGLYSVSIEELYRDCVSDMLALADGEDDTSLASQMGIDELEAFKEGLLVGISFDPVVQVRAIEDINTESLTEGK